MKITAHIAPAEDANGKTVYFRTVVPDPKDKSSYYEDNGMTGNDNGDTDIGAGKLNGEESFEVVSAVANLHTINGIEVAAAEVELTITDQYAGDNYQVEAALDPSFNSLICQISKTAVMTAWKRVYVATTGMYKKGAVVTVSKEADGDNEPDELIISSNSGLKKDDKIIIYGLNPTFEIERKILSKSGNKITVDDIDIFLKNMVGIRLKNDVDGIFTHLNFSQFHSDGLLKTYGNKTNGTDGGTFVEFTPYAGSIGFVPPLYSTITSDPLGKAYVEYWKEWSNNKNLILLIGANSYTGSSAQGITWSSINSTLIFKKNIDNVFSTANPPITVANKEEKLLAFIVSHEIGHQLGIANGLFTHIDKKPPIGNVYCHEGSTSDYCSMSYASEIFEPENPIIEFALNVIQYIRSFNDPI